MKYFELIIRSNSEVWQKLDTHKDRQTDMKVKIVMFVWCYAAEFEKWNLFVQVIKKFMTGVFLNCMIDMTAISVKPSVKVVTFSMRQPVT